MHEKFKEFEKVYQDALKSIRVYQEDKDIGVLVNWLLGTDINPYSFLEEGNLLGSAEGFSFLCHLLHHALLDDGDVTFFSVDKQPKIEFVHRTELKEYTRNDYNVVTDENGKKKLVKEEVKSDIVIFDNYHQFIDAIEEFATKDLKRCYLWDKDLQGEEFANEHYSKYKRFDPSWKNMNLKGDSINE